MINNRRLIYSTQSFLYIVLMIWGAQSSAVTANTFFASPYSQRTTDCTKQLPCSLEGVRNKVRTVNQAMTEDVIVNLRGGIYRLKNTFLLNESDSGNNGYRVIYQAFENEKPEFRGGVRVTGWSTTPFDLVKNIYRAPRPSVNGIPIQTRQLYVDGVRAKRAMGAPYMLGTIARTETGYSVSGAAIAQWARISDTEFVYSGGWSDPNPAFPGNGVGVPGAPWTQARCGVQNALQADGGAVAITMKQPCFELGRTNLGGKHAPGLPTWIENNYALLDEPGEWYMDDAWVYYIPKPNQNVGRMVAIAPVLEALVSGSGTATKPIHDIHFKGVRFTYATWLRPSTGLGFIEHQANAIYDRADLMSAPPGNVQFTRAYGIVLERNVFTHLGAQALVFDTGSKDNTVIGNVFYDVSSSAVRFGGVSARPTPTDHDSGNTFANNYVHEVAVEYQGAVGVFAAYAANTTISHNDISNLPYSGISLGWGWGAATGNTNNTISYNRVSDVMGLLFDGGHIYVNGIQTDCNMHNNWLSNGGPPPIYVDGSGGCNASVCYGQGWSIANNVVSQAAAGWIFVQNDAYRNSVQFNFADTPLYRMGSNPTNIYANNTIVADGAWPQAAIDIMNNAGIEPGYRDIIGPTPVPTNLAMRKPVTASSRSGTACGTPQATSYCPEKGNDGITMYSTVGLSAGPGPQWWQVDLGGLSTITQIQVATRFNADYPERRRNFEIWASNDETMADHVVLGGSGVGDLPFQTTFTLSVNKGSGPFRYLRIIKTVQNEALEFAEFRTFGY